MTILLLIRHASNDFVKEGRLAGWTPGVHINAQGQREADDLARRLAHLPLEAIYSSPLERAVDTANAVASCHKLPVQVRQDLGETRAGEWTGRLIKDVQDTEPWKAIQTRPVGVKIPGGESIDEVQTRIVAEVERIRRDHPDGIVAVVSHADPLKSIIAHYLHLDLNEYQRIVINPASVSIFFLGENETRLFRLNDTGPIPKFEKPKTKAQEQAVQPQLDAQPGADEPRKDKNKMTEANVLHDLNPVTRLTASAVGEPGHRVFYLQGRSGRTLVTVQAEKEQIASLATGISDMLVKLGDRADAPVGISPYELQLEEPVEPLFRVGQLGLGYDQETDRLVIVAYDIPTEEDPETVDVVRFWGSREQMRALARHALSIVAAGRPICVLCGKPIDPEGHFCPRRNGHGAHATLAD